MRIAMKEKDNMEPIYTITGTVVHERQVSTLSDVLERLTAERAELANGVDSEHPALVAFKKHQNIETLNREILIDPVSYTHLDVYKRQVIPPSNSKAMLLGKAFSTVLHRYPFGICLLYTSSHIACMPSLWAISQIWNVR